MGELVSELHCPGCNAPALVDAGDGTVQCQYCASSFAHPDRVCKCGAVSDWDDLDCPQCGHALRGLCPACNTPNPLAAETCRQCHTPLDLLASVAGRAGRTSADYIYERGLEAHSIKRQEELASEERLARMWERDQSREQQTETASARRQHKDLRLAQIVVGIFVFLIIAGLLLLLLTRLGA